MFDISNPAHQTVVPILDLNTPLAAGPARPHGVVFK
jgi:hypothetical protein